ncbi:MAG: HIT domain-containing protein [Gammaproteobacteria bacterium]
MPMDNFVLDSKLDSDCITIAEWDDCLLLLMNNALVPWFILVPKTRATELFQLDHEQQQLLQQHIDALSQFILGHFDVTKINVAAIGNVVSQLHVHVIGRSPEDYCWPGVVWGRSESEPYQPDAMIRICAAARKKLNLTSDTYD